MVIQKMINKTIKTMNLSKAKSQKEKVNLK
jgi:hypothetical protein